jgi:hypothetical protein
MMTSMEMRNYLKLFWLVPAIALLVPLVVIIMMATVRGRLGSVAGNIYEMMFLITPGVGVVVLLSLLVLLIFQPALLKRINLGATIAVAVLDVVSHVGFFVLGAILSGFSR